MSEALSSSEIEDVLSSIRRLVSDDMRPVAKSPSAAMTDGEKLLLTPALRVVQTDPQDAAPVGQDLESLVLSVGAGVSQQAEDWESETGDLAPVAESEGQAFAEASLQDWEDHQIDDYAEAVPRPDSLHDQLEAAEDAGETAEILPFSDPFGPETLPGWAQSSGAEAAEEAPADPWRGGTVEPDPIWADQAEAAVLQELAGASALPSSSDADEFVMNDEDGADVPVDEAMLREIVRDVLREELQGRLGERITRNIRKLVRAEIARVMAAEDFL